MKSISIKTQKILALIPIINYIGIFVLVYQCLILKTNKKFFIKTLFLLFPIVIFFGLGMATISSIFGNGSELYRVLSIVSGYLFPTTIFNIIIYAQIKYIDDL